MTLIKVGIKMIKKESINISEEKLNELEKQTKDKFTKFLIKDLKKKIDDKKEDSFYKSLAFERIVNLIECENKRNKLNEFNKKAENNLVMT